MLWLGACLSTVSLPSRFSLFFSFLFFRSIGKTNKSRPRKRISYSNLRSFYFVMILLAFISVVGLEVYPTNNPRWTAWQHQLWRRHSHKQITCRLVYRQWPTCSLHWSQRNLKDFLPHRYCQQRRTGLVGLRFSLWLQLYSFLPTAVRFPLRVLRWVLLRLKDMKNMEFKNWNWGRRENKNEIKKGSLYVRYEG